MQSHDIILQAFIKSKQEQTNKCIYECMYECLKDWMNEWMTLTN